MGETEEGSQGVGTGSQIWHPCTVDSAEMVLRACNKTFSAPLWGLEHSVALGDLHMAGVGGSGLLEAVQAARWATAFVGPRLPRGITSCTAVVSLADAAEGIGLRLRLQSLHFARSRQLDRVLMTVFLDVVPHELVREPGCLALGQGLVRAR